MFFLGGGWRVEEPTLGPAEVAWGLPCLLRMLAISVAELIQASVLPALPNA